MDKMETVSAQIGMQSNAQPLAIGPEQLKDFVKTLQEYKAGKQHTEQRILASENWWKLRNTVEEKKNGDTRADGFTSKSGWLHNVIVSKHADAVEAYPEPNILPREQQDVAEAQRLSSIIPCVFEQNHFEQTYSDVMWQKLKTGTGVYKVVWDGTKLNGLGDIGIERVNLLNIYWEPGVSDIQKSRYFFHTELHSKELLKQQYPQLEGKLKSTGFVSTKFLYDDAVNDTDKATVIDVYYRKVVNRKAVLHYCKFVDDVVLYATENETVPGKDINGKPTAPLAQVGLYAHGKYPYVFDALYPIEGSPCGYGYVDLCRNPQTEIDLLKTAFVKNARVGAVPRYFSRIDGNVNEEQFLNLDQALVQVSGNVDEATLRKIDHNSLDGNYIAMLDRTINELRETSGNTEASTGATPSGVTAASAIAALQEASGKGSRDATLASYRAYTKIVELSIELIRQFYTLPRTFRILGQYGMEKYISYTNSGLQPQQQSALGIDMGFRLPVFDIKISAQKKNVYTKVSQNELALQFFKMGFFNPQMTDQAIMCLELMDFDGKDGIMQKVAKNGTLQEKLMFYMQLAFSMATPDMKEKIYRDMMNVSGGRAHVNMGDVKMPESDNISGMKRDEHAIVENAREQSQNASRPDSGKVQEDKK